jgi:ceramide glucosyltransferase
MTSPISLDRIAAIIFAAAALCGVAYYLLVIWAGIRFLRKRPDETQAGLAPPVSILKPVYGADSGTYENFRSHCLQDYPEFEIIFALNEASDAALPLVERLQREFPERSIRFVVCPDIYGTNRKLGKLIHVLPQARYQHLLINDGDVRVPADYLQRVMEPFADDSVGMVTCLYRGVPGRTLGSKLEALGINTDFTAGVLVAREMEHGLQFGLGATLAVTRKALADSGGFEALVDYLADDYELGARIAAAGHKVVLSDLVVEVMVEEYSFRAFLRHQLRWARGMRNSRPGGYAGLVLTFGMLWALLAVIASGGAAWAWDLFGLALLTRFLAGLLIGKRVLASEETLRDLWLLPPRDLIAVAVWAGSFTGRRVVWGGKEFVLEDGKLRPAD